MPLAIGPIGFAAFLTGDGLLPVASFSAAGAMLRTFRRP